MQSLCFILMIPVMQACTPYTETLTLSPKHNQHLPSDDNSRLKRSKSRIPRIEKTSEKTDAVITEQSRGKFCECNDN